MQIIISFCLKSSLQLLFIALVLQKSSSLKISSNDIQSFPREWRWIEPLPTLRKNNEEIAMIEPVWSWQENPQKLAKNVESVNKEESLRIELSRGRQNNISRKKYVPFNSLTINSLYTNKKNNKEITRKPESSISEIPSKTSPSWWNNVSVKNKLKPIKYNSGVLNTKQTTEKYESYYPIKKRTDKPIIQVTEETTTVKFTEISNLKTPVNLDTGLQSVGEDAKESFENQDNSEENDNSARISWIQWLASKSKLTTKQPFNAKTTEEKLKDPFQSLLTSSLKFPGPPILLPTPGPKLTTKTSTTVRSTTAFTPWSWWTPSDEFLIADENKSELEEIISTVESKTEQNIEPITVKIYNEISTMQNDESDLEFDKEGAETMTSINYEMNTKVPEVHDMNEDNEEKENNDNQSMKEKYLKLVEHNSQLVEILKRTMEVQSDLFRRILKYMFP